MRKTGRTMKSKHNLSKYLSGSAKTSYCQSLQKWERFSHSVFPSLYLSPEISEKLLRPGEWWEASCKAENEQPRGCKTEANAEILWDESDREAKCWNPECDEAGQMWGARCGSVCPHSWKPPVGTHESHLQVTSLSNPHGNAISHHSREKQGPMCLYFIPRSGLKITRQIYQEQMWTVPLRNPLNSGVMSHPWPSPRSWRVQRT